MILQDPPSRCWTGHLKNDICLTSSKKGKLPTKNPYQLFSSLLELQLGGCWAPRDTPPRFTGKNPPAKKPKHRGRPLSQHQFLGQSEKEVCKLQQKGKACLPTKPICSMGLEYFSRFTLRFKSNVGKSSILVHGAYGKDMLVLGIVNDMEFLRTRGPC